MNSSNWIGGDWITPAKECLEVINPSQLTNQVGVLHLSDPEMALQAADAANKAQPGWGKLPSAKRGEYLFQVANLLMEHLEEVSLLASSEMGKPLGEMRGEVMRGIQILRYYAGEGVRANGSVIPANEANILQYTKRVPLGVVAIITPWNFPVAIPIWKIAPALICGNTIVWKPAETASLTATRLVQIFAEAQLPPGVLNLVIGVGSVVGTALLEKADLDGVSFTGSDVTGLRIAAACAQRNIKYQTEMGGKNAAIVLRDANLEKTIPQLLSGAFRSAGQKCTATSRIIVEENAYEPLLEGLSKSVSALKAGSALDETAYLGPVASKAQWEKVKAYGHLSEKDGEIIAQGSCSVDPTSGYFIAPKIVTGIPVEHALAQEEIFGPLAVILRARDFEASIELCNKTVYGLSASLYTQDLTKAMRFMEEAQAGLLKVNQETAGVEYQAPFGGMKLSSSHSREQGTSALEFYSQVKTCSVYFG
ncbi:putative aldehyde dehydrogenase YcbD [Paenibacillus baekrokdamisoli]|uniref:Putative aldehyde dehydrogenase YcbD n=1 Tax=Paenibacillus baekrokdamisoli TaxID=1712516 RepID=A0A3G9IMZ1_9BACL|nr:aldehyde dehydrogenase family protein [Paenibacillus baekrokdamisoli]MBB3073453.1 aldehyde dehydrogenase (NAD+) [Paenibacillus baekrokdamisoli]BBH20247.1 putative aldehyde dehydrogenase YcbD [Paenibacillus baekrokdamisoli]